MSINKIQKWPPAIVKLKLLFVVFMIFIQSTSAKQEVDKNKIYGKPQPEEASHIGQQEDLKTQLDVEEKPDPEFNH